MQEEDQCIPNADARVLNEDARESKRRCTRAELNSVPANTSMAIYCKAFLCNLPRNEVFREFEAACFLGIFLEIFVTSEGRTVVVLNVKPKTV